MASRRRRGRLRRFTHRERIDRHADARRRREADKLAAVAAAWLPSVAEVREWLREWPR